MYENENVRKRNCCNNSTVRSICWIAGEALVSYQGIALAIPQFIEIRRPFRGWNGVDFFLGRYNRKL